MTSGLEKFFIRNARPIPFLAGRFELASRVWLLIAPVLLFCMVILASRPELMGRFTASIWEKIGGWAAVVVMVLADIAFVYGLVGNR
ncbi:MAG TPA: hypothetical protein DEV93_11265 [Chloroflexi bacterium]|nr:hypothetical protein [Chloroflexota bacterium]